MDELRPHHREEEAELDDPVEASIDAAVIDRLAAYSHVAEPEPEAAPVHETTFEAVQPAVELAVEQAGSDHVDPALPSFVLDDDFTEDEPRRFGRRRVKEPKQPKPRESSEKKEKRPRKLVGLKIGASQIGRASCRERVLDHV